jgi:hypothetical protein
MSAQFCSNCRFAQVKGQKFECRIYPPTPQIAPEADDPKPKAIWPLVKGGDWCGRWAVGTPRP